MIEVLEGKYRLERDKYQWILGIAYESKSSKPPFEVSTKYREIYPATLEQACKTIVDLEGGKCKSVEGLISTIKDTADLLTKELRGISLKGEG